MPIDVTISEIQLGLYTEINKVAIIGSLPVKIQLSWWTLTRKTVATTTLAGTTISLRQVLTWPNLAVAILHYKIANVNTVVFCLFHWL